MSIHTQNFPDSKRHDVFNYTKIRFLLGDAKKKKINLKILEDSEIPD